jgi:hypothetical protein
MSNWSYLRSTIRCLSRAPSPVLPAGRLARPFPAHRARLSSARLAARSAHSRSPLTRHDPRLFTCSDSVTGVSNPKKVREWTAV